MAKTVEMSPETINPFMISLLSLWESAYRFRYKGEKTILVRAVVLCCDLILDNCKYSTFMQAIF
jgi:hypothetical protein